MERKAKTGCEEWLKGQDGRVGFIVTVQLRGKVPGWAWLVGWLPAMLRCLRTEMLLYNYNEKRCILGA